MNEKAIMTTDTEFKLSKDELEQMLSTDIADYQVTNLTEAGDNMGSSLLAVDVTLKTGKIIYLVAKMYPEDDFSIQVFSSPISMKKEIDMYLLVAPEFQKIQEEHAIPFQKRLDVFCRCLAARATRTASVDDDSDLADENSVILLENLKVLGYSSANRFEGMDLAQAEMMVSQLAKFHATPVAIKMNKPLVFRNKIMRALTPLKVKMGNKELDIKMMTEYLQKLGRKSLVCEKHMEKIIKLSLEEVESNYRNEFRTPLEPYATIVHNDLWTNNIMFKYISSRSNIPKPVSLKIVDFQFPSYGSPATDLLFFLFTSTNDAVLAEHLDHLLRLYHDDFVQHLRLFECNADKFTWDSFSRELSIFSAPELPHILGMLDVVMLRKEEAENRSKDPRENTNNVDLELKDELAQRAELTVKTFVDKGWL